MVELSLKTTRRGVQPESTLLLNLALTNGLIVNVTSFDVVHPEAEVAKIWTVFWTGAEVSFE
jgi:hypothetical protein